MSEEKKKVRSALDIALERFGPIKSPGPALTAEQKLELAEIDRRYQAQVAEKDVVFDERIRNAMREADFDVVEKLREEKSRELRGLKESMEKEKERVRLSP